MPAILVFNGTSSSTETPYTTNTYDRRGNVVETRDAAGGRTVGYYDALDRKVASVDPTGALSEYSYDDAGNLTRERAYSTRLTIASVVWTTKPAAVGSDTYREMEYVYDGNNRKIRAYTQAETYFDPRLLATLSNGNSVVTSSGYTTGRIYTRSDYDFAGNLTRIIDGRGYITLFFYDKLGQQILAVDAAGYVTRTEYDGAGNVSRQWRYGEEVVERNGCVAGGEQRSRDLSADRSPGDLHRSGGRRSGSSDRVRVTTASDARKSSAC